MLMRRFSILLMAAGSTVIGTDVASAACVVPNQIVNGQAVDATQVTADLSALVNCAANNVPGGDPNSLQLQGGGVFAGASPLSDGQLLVGSSSGAPVPKNLIAGPGIAIANSPGGVTISATGNVGSQGVDYLNAAAVVVPTVANFTLQTSASAPTGAALAGSFRGIMLSSVGTPTSSAMMAEANVPTGHWQATMLAVYSGPLSTNGLLSIAVRDAVSNRAVEFGISGNDGVNSWRFQYGKSTGGSGLNTLTSLATVLDSGLPSPSQPIWSRLTYDGANLSWSFSRDGEFFTTAYSAPAYDYLVNLSKIGPAAFFLQQTNSAWPAAYHILSWSLNNI